MINLDTSIPECSQEESLDEMLSPCPSLRAGEEDSTEKMYVPTSAVAIFILNSVLKKIT